MTANMQENRIFIYVLFSVFWHSFRDENTTVYDFFLEVVGNILSSVLYRAKFFVIHLLNIACSVLLCVIGKRVVNKTRTNDLHSSAREKKQIQDNFRY